MEFFGRNTYYYRWFINLTTYREKKLIRHVIHGIKKI